MVLGQWRVLLVLSSFTVTSKCKTIKNSAERRFFSSFLLFPSCILSKSKENLNPDWIKIYLMVLHNRAICIWFAVEAKQNILKYCISFSYIYLLDIKWISSVAILNDSKFRFPVFSVSGFQSSVFRVCRDHASDYVFQYFAFMQLQGKNYNSKTLG